MSWHTSPHIPENGAHIIVLYKGCESGNYFDITIREGDQVSHIEKWCYYEDYQESIKRKISNEKTM